MIFTRRSRCGSDNVGVAGVDGIANHAGPVAL